MLTNTKIVVPPKLFRLTFYPDQVSKTQRMEHVDTPQVLSEVQCASMEGGVSSRNHDEYDGAGSVPPSLHEEERVFPSLKYLEPLSNVYK